MSGGGNRNPGGGNQAISREQRLADAEERERKKFPKPMKFTLWACILWTGLWAVLISSGVWANKVGMCEVEMTWWDDKITTSLIISAIVSIAFTIMQSTWHERNI